MEHKRIGDIVRELRAALGEISQQQLATMMGASVSAVSGYEQGANPSVKALETLRDVARRHKQPELAQIFELHRLVNRGDTLPQFRTQPGDDLRADIGGALGIAMSRDPKLFAALLRAARPLIAQWKKDMESQAETRAEVDALLKELEEETKAIQAQRDSYMATLAESLGEGRKEVFLQWLREYGPQKVGLMEELDQATADSVEMIAKVGRQILRPIKRLKKRKAGEKKEES